MYREYLKRIAGQSPLIHVITNSVTNLFVADVLLALGCGAVMAADPAEVAEITTVSNALCLNTGTPVTNSRESYSIALITALEKGIPVALDFPGIPLSLLRQSTGRELLRLVSEKSGLQTAPVLVRANASEIYCLASGESHGGSIESIHSPAAIKQYANRLLTTVQALCISGSENIIMGERSAAVPGGSPLMSRVSGFGCISTALMAAFFSQSKTLHPDSPAASAAEAVCLLMRDAAAGAGTAAGPGSFKTAFIDSLYKISQSTEHQECT